MSSVIEQLPPVFDRKVLAEAIGTTPRHLLDLDNRGNGPPLFRVGRKVRFSRDAVAQWVAANTVVAA